jgi:hypothetical protein
MISTHAYPSTGLWVIPHGVTVWTPMYNTHGFTNAISYFQLSWKVMKLSMLGMNIYCIVNHFIDYHAHGFLA